MMDDLDRVVRRFCPRCGRTADGPTLCPDCGETMSDRGYCAVCEGCWNLPPGADCPKHEIPLGVEPTAPIAIGPTGEAAELVTIGRFTRPGEAEALRLRLEAEGIPTFFEGERMGIHHVATGGLKLQVPRPFASDARILQAQTWAPPEHDDLDDAWDELAPEPGRKRRAVMKALILVMLFGPLALFALSWLLR
jgi:hypothetical protein